ncbi:MAG: diguanylate cyclase [Rubrivivax sp.]|nr:diguanylate cyclase [Rubrivivax sp.]
MPGTARRVWVIALWLGLLSALSLPALAQPLRVDARADLPVWPGVTVWADADAALTPEQALAERGRFTVPAGTPSNLGRSTGALWLRFALQVDGDQPLQRVLEIDYPSLNRVDLYLVRDGRIVQERRMGNALRQDERPMPSRTHAVPLQLSPGTWEVLLHVQTRSSMVLPITLRTPESFTAHESRVQIVQGIVLGLALCMLLYSLTQGLGLRDTMFLDYALLLAGNVVFTLAYFGTGAQYLWPDWPGLSQRVAPMAVMVAVAAAARFMAAALAVHEISRFIARLLHFVSIAALCALAATLLGLLDYPAAQTLVTVLGIVATAVVLPAAYIRARRGERTAFYMLFGWTFYALGAMVMAGLLRGRVEPTFWSQHVYPFSLMVEMAAWLSVLSLRVQAIHRNADRARLETETLRTLSQTDALTGLPNRRGLQQQLAAALPRASPQRLLALFLLDLDGFKPVNDRYGHDVGDALLRAVGHRLQAQLRGSDVVARLGGDEFVVLVGDLADEAAALAVGQKLLGAIDAPFLVAGQHCEVGLTAGYALAPLDGSTADELIKRADAAMYAGKQAGRRRVQRGGRSLAMA